MSRYPVAPYRGTRAMADWRDGLEGWLDPFLTVLGHEKRGPMSADPCREPDRAWRAQGPAADGEPSWPERTTASRRRASSKRPADADAEARRPLSGRIEPVRHGAKPPPQPRETPKRGATRGRNAGRRNGGGVVRHLSEHRKAKLPRGPVRPAPNAPSPRCGTTTFGRRSRPPSAEGRGAAACKVAGTPRSAGPKPPTPRRTTQPRPPPSRTKKNRKAGSRPDSA